MTKQLDILLIEDNEKHLADAQAEAQKRIAAGEQFNINFARDLFGSFDFVAGEKKYDGIISDIFFPSSIQDSYHNLANNLVWNIFGRKYITEHSEDYRCGNEFREKIFELVQDGWMNGKELPPSGIIIADAAIKQGVPIVFCTDTYHHGIKTQPIFEYAIRNKIMMVDSPTAQNGNAQSKNWSRAFSELMEKIKSGEKA